MSTVTTRPSLVYVVNTLNTGGTERLVVDMSRAFARDFDVRVVCLDEPGVWAADLRRDSIPVHCVWRQPGLDLAVAANLARHFREAGANIVHAHQCTPWFYSALARLWHSAPKLLLEEHGRFYPEVNKPWKRLVNRLLVRRLTHRFVAVSEDIRDRLARFEGLDAAQVEVVYNGVPVPEPLAAECRAAQRAALGFAADDFVVGAVGRLDPIKNLPMLVESLRRVTVERKQVRGLIVGDGPLAGELHEAVQRARLSERVRFTGYRADARVLMQCLDLYVLSSFSEGTSMALLEAVAAGVPVAVTAVGGNAEIVIGGETGWVVPSGGVDELSTAVQQAVAFPALAARYAAAGRQRFLEQFSFDSMIERYRVIYRELLSASAPSAIEALRRA